VEGRERRGASEARVGRVFSYLGGRYAAVASLQPPLLVNSNLSTSSITAKAAAHETGLPPNVLKYSIPQVSKFLMTDFLTQRAEMGWPFPSGLPTVTISGTSMNERSQSRKGLG